MVFREYAREELTNMADEDNIGYNLAQRSQVFHIYLQFKQYFVAIMNIGDETQTYYIEIKF